MFTKLIRLGQDAELRYLPSNTPVLSFSGAYDVGYGDKKRTQWIDCAKFGESVEKIKPYLVKGKQVVIYADDLRIDTWPKQDGGEGYKLACKVINLELAGGDPNQGQPNNSQPPQHPSYETQKPQHGMPATSGDEFDDSIPFS